MATVFKGLVAQLLGSCVVRRMCRVHVSVFLLVVWFSPTVLSADLATKKMRTTVLSEGSVPPGLTLFACIKDLDNKLYSHPQIKDCVGKLRANYFIRDVKVTIQEEKIEDRWVNIEFVLYGEPLTIDKFTIVTFDQQEADIWNFLSRSDGNLHVGGIYNWSVESWTYNSIEFFYRAQGILVGIVPTVTLDYKQRKAWISFKVIQGPPTLRHPLVPPYGKPCSDHASYIDWSGTDDGVPVELIESDLALASSFTCFSEELAQRDKQYLSSLGFLSNSSVEYSGSLGSRRLVYNLKAKPLKVEKINLRGYGHAPSKLEDSDPSLLKNLKLKTGVLFSRWAVHESTEYLRKAFTKDGYWAEVRVQEELSGADALRVTFSVLVFPLQTIVVDGHLYQSPTMLANDEAKVP